MTRSQALGPRLFLLALSLPLAALIAGCFGPEPGDPDSPALTGDGGAQGMGGATGIGGATADTTAIGGATGTTSTPGNTGAGGMGAGGVGAGGSTGDGGRIGIDGPVHGMGGQSGTGGAGAGGSGAGGSPTIAGTGGAAGATPVCAAHCIQDPPLCRCTVTPGECPQLFEVACPRGAGADCTCRLNGATVATFPGSAICDPGLLTAASACGFAVVIPN